MSLLERNPVFADAYEAQVEAAKAKIATLPTVEESLASTRAHLDRIALQLAHQTPCNLLPSDCPICEDREWHVSATRDAARDE